MRSLLNPNLRLLPNSRLGTPSYCEPGRSAADVNFVFQLISIAPVIEDLIPDREFHLSEAGPFDNENSSSFVQRKFFRLSHRQILSANLVAFTCHVDSVHLFQIVIERACQLICRQSWHEVGVNPSMFEDNRFTVGETRSLEIAHTCSAIYL